MGTERSTLPPCSPHPLPTRVSALSQQMFGGATQQRGNRAGAGTWQGETGSSALRYVDTRVCLNLYSGARLGNTALGGIQTQKATDASRVGEITQREGLKVTTREA